MIWRREATLAALNKMGANNMVGHVGIEFTRFDDNEIEATMPVDERTRQPFGLLHGGASVVLAGNVGLGGRLPVHRRRPESGWPGGER
ncbi:Esterase YdiI [Cedecea neteri]|uniref:Esterase YdiI n=1 Tax=Cedecea neteri TaxID=158822 RepID=A0A2X3IL17_9ENTR|nr:Esterase YdiI [Cedecea neteri]